MRCNKPTRKRWTNCWHMA